MTTGSDATRQLITLSCWQFKRCCRGRGLGLSIGVGTGRFAAPLGVQVGIDPSHAVLGYAAQREIAAVEAVAEALPFPDGMFDSALCVTALCFVDDAGAKPGAY